jgi:hypothetical protein
MVIPIIIVSTKVALTNSTIIDKVMAKARTDPSRFMTANLNDPLAGTMADSYDEEKSEEIAMGLWKSPNCNYNSYFS